MIYVLAGTRREAAAWRMQEGERIIRFVQTSGTFPGRLTSKSRIVQLPGFAARRDTFAIKKRLRQVTRLDNVEVEMWLKRDDEVGDFYRDLGEPVPERMLDSGDYFAEDTWTEPEETGPTVTVVPTTEEPPASHTELVERVLADIPSSDAPTEPGDLVVVSDFDFMTDDNFTPPAAEAEKPESVTERENDPDIEPSPEPAPFAESKESPAPKRVRRTKAQIAYDTALASWESNGGSLNDVETAKSHLKADDPRLAAESDDLDF